MNNKTLCILPVFLWFSACTTVPKKVPELIETSANQATVQSEIMVAEWENAIKAADSSKKLLSLVNQHFTNLNMSSLTEQERQVVTRFKVAYPVVMRELDNVISQKSQPQRSKENFAEITKAIRFANKYVAETVSENARIEAVIQSLNSLKDKKGE